MEFLLLFAVGPIPIIVDFHIRMLVGIGHDGILLGQFGFQFADGFFQALDFFVDLAELGINLLLAFVVDFVLRDRFSGDLLRLLLGGYLQLLQMSKILLLQKVVDVANVLLDVGLAKLVDLVGQALQEVTVVGDDN